MAKETKTKDKAEAAPKRIKKQSEVDAVDARIWSCRLHEAASLRNEALEHGDVIREMVSGRSTDQLKLAMATYGDDWVPADWNKMAPLVKVLIPALLHNEPDVTVTPWDELDEVSVRKAELYTFLCRRFIHSNKRLRHSKAALFESIVYGKGVLFTDYNKAEKQPRTRYLSIKNVYIDPNYDGTPETMQWAARDLILPLELAKKKWPEKAKELRGMVSGLTEGEEHRVEEDEGIDQKKIKDHVSLIEVWISGKSNEYPDQALGEAGIESGLATTSDEHSGYHGKSEVLTILRNAEKKAVIIERKPWPYTLDEDEFPFSFLELTNDPGKSFGESILNPVRRLQEVMNIGLAALVSRQVSSSQDVIAIDENAFEDSEAVIAQLQQKKQLSVVKMKKGHKIEHALQQMALGLPNQANISLMQETGAMFDEGSNFNELTSGDVRKSPNATAAQFSEERRQSSIANAVQEVEYWQADISRKELMVAQSLMTAEDVAEVAPPRLTGEAEEQQDNDGEVVAVYPYWNDNITPREIRNESQCFVRPGSMRFMSVEERRDAMVEMMRVYQESLAMATNSGYEVPKEAIVAIFKMAEHLARLAGIPEFRDLQIDAEMLVPIEDEAAQQEEIAQQSAQAQQQLAQALPQMIQQAVAPMLGQMSEALMTKLIEAIQLMMSQPPQPQQQMMQPQAAVNPLQQLMGGV